MISENRASPAFVKVSGNVDVSAGRRESGDPVIGWRLGRYRGAAIVVVRVDMKTASDADPWLPDAIPLDQHSNQTCGGIGRGSLIQPHVKQAGAGNRH